MTWPSILPDLNPNGLLLGYFQERMAEHLLNRKKIEETSDILDAEDG